MPPYKLKFFRILESMIYGCRSRSTEDIMQRRALYDRMVDEDTDAMLLRLFEAFMENAPQLVLQLYIMTQIGTSEGVFLGNIHACDILDDILLMEKESHVHIDIDDYT